MTGRIDASTMLYPWDLADLGVEKTLAALAADGFTGVDLAATYHPLTSFSPGAPGRRLFHTDAGGVFFPVDQSRYGTVRPRTFPEAAVLEAWPRAAAAASNLGLRLTAWLPVLYQPWIVREHPECTRRMPTGHRSPNGLCPASPAVRDYVSAVATDLASAYSPTMVQLEGISFPHYDDHWLATRTLVEVPAWIRWLLGLCFCQSCTSAAESADVDVERLRRRLIAEIENNWTHGPSEDDRQVEESHLERCADDPDYERFCELREQAPLGLVHQVADAVQNANPAVRLAVWGPRDSSGLRWQVESVMDRVGALKTVSQSTRPGEVAEARALADRFEDVRVRSVQWCGPPVAPLSGAAFAEGVRSSVELGVDELTFFNWAMLPPNQAATIVPRLRALEAEHERLKSQR